MRSTHKAVLKSLLQWTHREFTKARKDQFRRSMLDGMRAYYHGERDGYFRVAEEIKKRLKQ